MTDSRQTTYDTRGAQMFLHLLDNEIGRIAHFGERRRFRAGESLARPGEAGEGLMLSLSGSVEVTRAENGRQVHIVTHERGNFLGELAQLSGPPFLVHPLALTDAEAVLIRPDPLPALLPAQPHPRLPIIPASIPPPP